MSVQLTQVADGIYGVTGEAVNWVLAVDGDAVTLIDAGYPGDHDDVVESLRLVGRTVDDIAAVLITHAHVDHIGSLPRLLDGRSTPVLTSAVEATHAHRDRLEQATPADVARNAWRPLVLTWSVHVMRAGGLDDVSVPQAAALELSTPLDLPGRPTAVLTEGHTSGHTMYHFADEGIVVSGDALVTGHSTTTKIGPQLLPDFFHHDLERNRASLRHSRELAADTIVPGHGSVWRQPWADAVARAIG